MHITVSRDALLAALSPAVKASDTRHTVPILGNVMLSASGGKLTVTGTDMELITSASAPCEGEGGQCTAPAKSLLAFVKALPKGSTVTLQQTDDTLSLSGAGRSAKLTTLPTEDFPLGNPPALTHNFTLPATDFARILRHTRPAISTEETRYYLNGIYLCIADGMLRAVATDGHRMVVSDTAPPEGLSEIPHIIVPRLMVGAALDVLGAKPVGDVAIGLSDTRIRLTYGSVVVTSKLIDGTYPEYQRVIPRYNDKGTLTTNAKELADTAKSVAGAVSRETSRAVKLTLNAQGCNVSAFDHEGGSAEARLNGTTAYVGADGEVGFQARYLRDMASGIEGDIHIAFNEFTGPALFTADSAPGWMGILMPIRV